MKFFALITILFLTACAQGANYNNMTYTPSPTDAQKIDADASFYVESVLGGEDTNPLWSSEIDNLSFKMALEKTLKSLDIYEKIDSKYEINVLLKDVDQPLFGLTFTVKTIIEYEIVERQTRQTVYKEILEGSGVASVSDAFSGVERLKIANERSGKANITKFVKKLIEEFPT